MAKPRKLQEIFNVVINAGLYKFGNGLWYSGDRFPCMCKSLDDAQTGNLITENEHYKARKALSNYMLGYKGTLYRLLEHNNLPNSYQDRLAIYRNWAKRPKLRKKIWES